MSQPGSPQVKEDDSTPEPHEVHAPHRRAGQAPPWWPSGQPPPRMGWWHAGPMPRQRPGRGRWRPLGCLVLLFGLFAAGTVVVGLWAAAAIIGLVEAPTIVVAAGLVAFVVVAIGAVGLARGLRRFTLPLDDLIAASGRIEAGDYAARVPVSGGREMRSLARAFNGMSAELEAAEQRRRAFLAEVTHELRTPLTVIRGQLEAIEDGVYAADPERIASVRAQADLMARLVEDLHTISLAEVGGLRLRPRVVDVRDLLDEMVAAHAPAAEAAGVALEADGVSGSRARLDVAASRRVLGNLVANAVRATPAGGTVTLGSRPSAPWVEVAVRDTGRGMGADLAARAFERFEKGEGSDGSGLGLSIARDLVEAQGGTIELTSALGTGTTVTVRFPAEPASRGRAALDSAG